MGQAQIDADEKRCLAQRRKVAKRGRISTPQRNSLRIPQGRGYVYENNLCNQRNLRINVCDAEAYEFNRIIRVFKESGIRPNRPVISVPLSVVWFATRIAGFFFSNKKEWIHSCYDKLANDLVFDSGRMMGTGFRARHSLETLIDPQIPQTRLPLQGTSGQVTRIESSHAKAQRR